MEDRGPPLEVVNLRKSFAGKEVLCGVSLTVRAGRIVGLFGPNGSGKSTLIRGALGLVRADGESRFFGTPYPQLRYAGSVAGITFTTPRFHPARSARDELRLAAAACGPSRRDPYELLDQVGLTAVAGERVETFSRGMLQRLALARALVGCPPLLILDEPSEGIDPDGVTWLRDLMLDHAQHGGSALVASHVLDQMAQVVDDVVVLDRGTVVVEGALDDLCPPRVSVRVRASDHRALQAGLERAGVEVASTETGLEARHVEAARVGKIAAELDIAIEQLVTHELPRQERLRLALSGAARTEAG
ncbi:MAG: ATP-binding cassette domain-containing protein [Solirubrobacteraceae bacterium]